MSKQQGFGGWVNKCSSGLSPGDSVHNHLWQNIPRRRVSGDEAVLSPSVAGDPTLEAIGGLFSSDWALLAQTLDQWAGPLLLEYGRRTLISLVELTVAKGKAF